MELEDLANSKLNPIIDFWLVAISKKNHMATAKKIYFDLKIFI